MRVLMVAALCLIATGRIFAADAAAQHETVTVESDSPVGLWKITFPQSFGLHLIGKTEWGPLTNEFCQIEKTHADLMVHCLGLRVSSRDVSRGSVRVKTDTIRMAWGSTLIYVAINGTLRSATQFDGTVSVNVVGISSDAPEKVTGTKLSVPPDTPDKGGKSELLARLLDEMEKGAVTMPFGAPASTMGPTKSGPYVKLLKPDTLEALGALQSMVYLGEGGGTPAASEYDVEFANGHLICALHQDGDNRLDQFDCG